MFRAKKHQYVTIVALAHAFAVSGVLTCSSALGLRLGQIVLRVISRITCAR